MPVEVQDDFVIIRHREGPSAKVLLYGATVISWKYKDKERLFVSSEAKLDGSQPVRGGIPVIFPCFGPPTHPEHLKLPPHGFARRQTWKYDKTILDNQAGVSARFSLEPNDSIRAVYSRAFRLTYIVTVMEHELTTDLHVDNPSIRPEILEFQALLHTYISAPADEAKITPLKGVMYYDKTEATDEDRATPKIESRDEVTVSKHTDSVYEGAPLNYKVSWPDGFLDIRAKYLKDVVVWNPQEEGHKIADLEPDGWKKFVCVEPGHVRGFVQLEAGKMWMGYQILSSIE